MRAIKAILGIILGLGVGLALGYGLVSWLLEQQRGGQADAGGRTLPASRLVEQLQTRIRVAVDEGRRAAQEARAELEAEAYGQRRRPEDGEAVI